MINKNQKYNEFYKKIIKLEKDANIIKRNSEENIKIKIIIPLLQALGYDIKDNMQFEYFGADIVLFDKDKPILIIETKSWNETLTKYLGQCLEYCLKIKTPLVMITSGNHTLLYSCLLNPNKLKEPILDFSFNKLLNKNFFKREIEPLIGKQSLTKGKNIEKRIIALLGNNKELQNAKKQFEHKYSDLRYFKKTTPLMTEDRFNKIIEKYPTKIRKLLMYALDEFKGIEKEYGNIVKLRFGPKEIGLVYIDKDGTRKKDLGLGGIYPEKQAFSFGIKSWEIISSSKLIGKKLGELSGKIESKEQIKKLISLINKLILKK